jgi:hypothetical protein
MADLGPGDCVVAIDPQVKIEPDAHKKARLLETRGILALADILDIHASTRQRRRQIPAHGPARLPQAVVVVTT